MTTADEDAPLEDLLLRYGRADAAAFREFYARTSRILFSYLLSRLGSRSDAEEALQDTYLRIHRHIDTFRPGKGAMAWCFAIARNAMVDLYHRRPREISGQDPEFGATSLAVTNQEEALVASEELSRILAELSPGERTLIEMRFLQDKSLAEIAESMAIDPANARQRLSRLLRKIKQTR